MRALNIFPLTCDICLSEVVNGNGLKGDWKRVG